MLKGVFKFFDNNCGMLMGMFAFVELTEFVYTLLRSVA